MNPMRTGITTGTCAAAAAKAAACLLMDCDVPSQVRIALPGGNDLDVPVLWARMAGGAAEAAVRKDAGDDPDVTDGMEIIAKIDFAHSGDVTFAAGEGVGTVTKPGLQVPPGEPAINPVPRNMIASAIRELTDRPVCVEISIPGGLAVAEKTFNPRLGIVGGLSILGTTGIVRPYCRRAMQDAITCAMDVAQACGLTAPVLVPGNIGAAGAERYFRLAEQQLIEVGNEWGFALDAFQQRDFSALLVVGHPGKLAKLIDGHWNTHSSASPSATEAVTELANQELGLGLAESETVEGLLEQMASADAHVMGDALAERICRAIKQRLNRPVAIAVCLINMARERIGCAGDLSNWEGRDEH